MLKGHDWGLSQFIDFKSAIRENQLCQYSFGKEGTGREAIKKGR